MAKARQFNIDRKPENANEAKPSVPREEQQAKVR